MRFGIVLGSVFMTSDNVHTEGEENRLIMCTTPKTVLEDKRGRAQQQ